jgi:hypothetical protein
MDVPYWISGGVVLGSAAFTSPTLPSDSKVLRSESDIFAMSARGSCGVDPGPVPLRIVTFSASSMGDWLYGVRKRLVLLRSLMFSNFVMLRFTTLTVRGGGTDLALMRPRKGSPGVTGVFEEYPRPQRRSDSILTKFTQMRIGNRTRQTLTII